MSNLNADFRDYWSDKMLSQSTEKSASDWEKEEQPECNCEGCQSLIPKNSCTLAWDNKTQKFLGPFCKGCFLTVQGSLSNGT